MKIIDGKVFFEKQYIFTKEGFEALKHLRLLGVDIQKAKEILSILDNSLSREREILRHYKGTFGDDYNMYNRRAIRIRLMKEIIDELEDNINEN